LPASQKKEAIQVKDRGWQRLKNYSGINTRVSPEIRTDEHAANRKPLEQEQETREMSEKEYLLNSKPTATTSGLRLSKDKACHLSQDMCQLKGNGEDGATPEGTVIDIQYEKGTTKDSNWTLGIVADIDKPITVNGKSIKSPPPENNTKADDPKPRCPLSADGRKQHPEYVRRSRRLRLSGVGA